MNELFLEQMLEEQRKRLFYVSHYDWESKLKQKRGLLHKIKNLLHHRHTSKLLFSSSRQACCCC
jgi:hypothetical protein